jgi:hypothetical protein
LKKTPLLKSEPETHSTRVFWRKEGLAILALTASLLFCFKDWIHFSDKIFLSLDSTVLYYPITLWVHDHLIQGKLPLISDLVYNGAPMVATSMAGISSPFIWLIHSVASGVLLVNLLFVIPFCFYLFGAYFLGRELSLSSSASVFLAFLWTYNGHQMAQLDHQNVAWAHAFFPWAFLCLLRYQAQKRLFWLLSGSFLWGLCLFSGHPQVVFLQGLFFSLWTLLYPHFTLKKRLISFSEMTFGTLIFTAPLTLFTSTFLSGEKWNDLDRFFHSWTPVNFITLLFPWFFGKDQYDRTGSDYWWQYQFLEMQITLSIVGLFFVLLFFFSKRPDRRWITVIALFGLTMALGKFFFVYPLVQSLPFFSFFRDPARYWFLITWAVGLGAAYIWDDWFKNEDLYRKGKKLSLGLLAIAISLVVLGWLLLNLGQPLIKSIASWFIQHYLLGDSLHTLTLSAYLERLPAKLDSIAANLNPLSLRVWTPLLFLIGLTFTISNRNSWNLSLQKTLLIAFVFIDLMTFRMPLGNSFYSPSDIPGPQVPTAQNRSLPLISQTNSPLPAQYGQYAFPNMNLISQSPVLPFDANPSLGRYNTLLSQLGWFAWVYKDRDLLGFINHPHLLSVLGVDQIVSDTPFKLPQPFKTIQNHLPYVYGWPNALSRAYLVNQYQITPWPESINRLEAADFKPPKEVLLESNPGFPSASKALPLSAPENSHWGETHLSFTTQTQGPSLLVLQKTFLPGWKATVNGISVEPLLCNLVLIAVPLQAGVNQVELTFSPMSLRVGFFLFFLFLAVFVASIGFLLIA